MSNETKVYAAGTASQTHLFDKFIHKEGIENKSRKQEKFSAESISSENNKRTRSSPRHLKHKPSLCEKETSSCPSVITESDVPHHNSILTTNRKRKKLSKAVMTLAATTRAVATVSVLPSVTSSTSRNLAIAGFAVNSPNHASSSQKQHHLRKQLNSVHSSPHPSLVTSSPYFSTRTNYQASTLLAVASDKNMNNDSPSIKKVQKKEQGEEKVNRTNSFDPIWAGTFDPSTNIKVHTLICGTHPSITSLAKSKYFGHPMNAFWWIAGDCLGFRRSSAISESSGKEYTFSKDLWFGMEKIIPYEEQINTLALNGFALWDVVKSCERKGSLDMDIKKEEPNDLRGFCDSHPTIRRIVLANGNTQSTIFNRHFKDWWLSGDLKPADNEHSIKNFKKFAKATKNFENAKIECVCALAVSPAAATYSYVQKRTFWEKYCYKPGLSDHSCINESSLV